MNLKEIQKRILTFMKNRQITIRKLINIKYQIHKEYKRLIVYNIINQLQVMLTIKDQEIDSLGMEVHQ